MRSCDFNWQARAGEIKKSVAFVRTEFNVLGVRCIICILVHRYVLRDTIRTDKGKRGRGFLFFLLSGSNTSTKLVTFLSPNFSSSN